MKILVAVYNYKNIPSITVNRFNIINSQFAAHEQTTTNRNVYKKKLQFLNQNYNFII